MLSRMHQKFGTAGLVVAVVALVVALTGAAFAAGGLTKQQEKQVKKIARKFAGKKGPKGDPGPAGAQGPKGDTGPAGKDGISGTNGTNGTDGEDGMCTAGNPACELPARSELVGAWGTSGNDAEPGEQQLSLTPISFNVRVSPAPTALWEFEFAPGQVGGVKLEDGAASPYEFTTEAAFEEAWENACPGTADQPAAEPGFLCIYTKEMSSSNVTNPLGAQGATTEAANEWGINVAWKVGIEGFAKGSWAVSAE